MLLVFQGNIRVFCRVRPLLGEEMLGHQTESPDHMTFSEEDPKTLQLEKGAETGGNDVSSFFYLAAHHVMNASL